MCMLMQLRVAAEVLSQHRTDEVRAQQHALFKVLYMKIQIQTAALEFKHIFVVQTQHQGHAFMDSHEKENKISSKWNK